MGCRPYQTFSRTKGLKAEEIDLSYYMMGNLQTLCKPCHRKKTNSEVHLKKKRKLNFKGTQRNQKKKSSNIFRTKRHSNKNNIYWKHIEATNYEKSIF